MKIKKYNYRTILMYSILTSLIPLLLSFVYLNKILEYLNNNYFYYVLIYILLLLIIYFIFMIINRNNYLEIEIDKITLTNQILGFKTYNVSLIDTSKITIVEYNFFIYQMFELKKIKLISNLGKIITIYLDDNEYNNFNNIYRKNKERVPYKANNESPLLKRDFLSNLLFIFLIFMGLYTIVLFIVSLFNNYINNVYVFSLYIVSILFIVYLIIDFTFFFKEEYRVINDILIIKRGLIFNTKIELPVSQIRKVYLINNIFSKSKKNNLSLFNIGNGCNVLLTISSELLNYLFDIKILKIKGRFSSFGYIGLFISILISYLLFKNNILSMILFNIISCYFILSESNLDIFKTNKKLLLIKKGLIFKNTTIYKKEYIKKVYFKELFKKDLILGLNLLDTDRIYIIKR